MTEEVKTTDEETKIATSAETEVKSDDRLDKALEQISKLSSKVIESEAKAAELEEKIVVEAKKDVKAEPELSDIELANKALLEQNEKLQLALEQNRIEVQQSQINSDFSTSEFVKGLAVPFELTKSYFEKSFSFDENGRVQAKDSSGNVIMSKVNIGSKADFNEAIESLVESSPFRDSLIKSQVQSGIPSDIKSSTSSTSKTTSRSKILAGLKL